MPLGDCPDDLTLVVSVDEIEVDERGSVVAGQAALGCEPVPATSVLMHYAHHATDLVVLRFLDPGIRLELRHEFG